MFACPLGVLNSLFHLHAWNSFCVTLCCGDEGIYRLSFLSSTKVNTIAAFTLVGGKFIANNVHGCIDCLCIPAYHFLNSLQTKLLFAWLAIQLSWLNSQGLNLASPFICPCRWQKSNKMSFEICVYMDVFSHGEWRSKWRNGDLVNVDLLMCNKRAMFGSSTSIVTYASYFTSHGPSISL